MLLIFQYGSNCSTVRLNSPERLDGEAIAIGRAQTVIEYEIAFDVWSKCNGCAAADLIPAHGTGLHAWGVLYETSEKGLKRLRKVEGPRYEKKAIHVRNCAGKELEATTFLGKCSERKEGLRTSGKYVGYIVTGLRDHEIPKEYTEHVLDIAIRTNEEAMCQDAAKAQGAEQDRHVFIFPRCVISVELKSVNLPAHWPHWRLHWSGPHPAEDASMRTGCRENA
jgi:hypothetical protein